jgi:hypothetical protein
MIRLDLRKDGEEYDLPFRPLVFGGDDLTFVCDGRVGLSLTLEYLRQFESCTAKLSGGKLTASAGVAIVKSHYPFARAYALADELCREAKKYRRELVRQRELWSGSCIHWHFASSGLSGNGREILDREYKADEGVLTLRPVCTGENPVAAYRSWNHVENLLNKFRGEEWYGRRSKVKALREALRKGKAEVERFQSKYGKLPALEGFDNGWSGGFCGYFDAIELMDLHLPLEDKR